MGQNKSKGKTKNDKQPEIFDESELENLQLTYDTFTKKNRDHLLKSDFEILFCGDEFMSTSYYEFFIHLTKTLLQETINFNCYKTIVGILIKDNSDMDILKLDSDIDKLEIFFLVMLGVKDFNEKMNISLEKEKVFLLIKSILLMFPENKEIINNEEASINSLCDTIMELNPEKISFSSFVQRLKTEFIYLTKVIKQFLLKSFVSSKYYKLELPKLSEPSRIMNPIQLSFFFLTSNSFQNLNQIDLIYCPRKEGSSFNRLVHSLLGYEGPTLFLLKHIEKNDRENNYKDTKYIIGAFSQSSWKEDLAYGGDQYCYLIKVFPKFHNLFTYKGQGGINYSYLNSKKIDKSKYKVGLGFGGYEFSDYRLWIDDDIESKSYINDDDKTYERGSLADYHINKLNLEEIEIWGLGSQKALQAQEIYRENERKQIESMRKVDKKAFLNNFDKGMFLEKTFAHAGQVRGDELEKEQ